MVNRKCFNVSAPDFQRVFFLFLSRCKGTFKRAPCDKTLFISKAERKYLSDSKGTDFWWMAVYLCPKLCQCATTPQRHNVSLRYFQYE